LYVEAKTNYDSSQSRRICLSSGTSDNRVSLEFDESSENKLKVVISSGGLDTQFEYSDDDVDLAQFNKIAIKYKVNDFALWLNGSKKSTASSGATPIGLDRLAFDKGDATPVTSEFFGQVRNIQVYKTALTDDQLAALTT